MTDDLVKRLRDVQENWPWCEIELEAADRIEQLEAALQPFADPCIEHCFERCESECDSMEECPCFIARATLAGEKKDE
jgi:hypothetical protein